MKTNHFSYFRVKNFKRFRDLEVKDIGQFNLILGDNNVGKTSLLEALMFTRMDEFILALSARLDKRNIGGALTDGVWGLYVNNEAKFGSQNEVLTEFQVNSANFVYSFNKVTKKLRDIKGGYAVEKILEGADLSAEGNEIQNPKGYGGPADYFEPFISNLDRHDYSLTKQFSVLVNKNERNLEYELIDSLKAIDKTIRDIRHDDISSSRPLLGVGTENQKGRTLLALFGDGTISLFRILLFIHLFKGGKLMLDEVDAGVYHERMKDYWKTILETAEKNNVQIFASTHSKECLSAFDEAIGELNIELKNNFSEKARTITLKASENSDKITAYTNPISVLQFALESGNDLR